MQAGRPGERDNTTIDTYEAKYNHPEAGTGQALLGLVGYYGINYNESGQANHTIDVSDFRKVREGYRTYDGYTQYEDLLVAAIYAAECDASC